MLMKKPCSLDTTKMGRQELGLEPSRRNTGNGGKNTKNAHGKLSAASRYN